MVGYQSTTVIGYPDTKREGEEVDVNGQMSIEEGSWMKHWGLFFLFPLVLAMSRRHDLKVHKLSTVGNYSK